MSKKSDAWELLDTYQFVECVIVQSTTDKGLVSLRPSRVKPTEGGLGTTLRTRLTEAGFRPGDEVMIVPLKRPRRRKAAKS